jgi:hypothetical protein
MAERDDMDPDDAPVTRREFREELKRFATKEDLEIWGGALEARLEATLGAQLAQIQADLARHTKAIVEAMTTQIGVIDDKYKDLPPRVAKLEDIEARRAARRRGPRQS